MARFVIPGVTTVTGSVPPATGRVERAEDGFGQGKVVASTFGVAVAVAVLITDAGESIRAVQATARFLSALR